MGALRHKLIIFSKGIAHISTLSEAAHLVNLHKGTCKCLEFQDRYLPYYHAMVVYKDQVLEPEEFTSFIYTVDNYHNVYSENFALDPIWVEDLESLACLAPLVQKKKRATSKKAASKIRRKKRIRQKGIILFVEAKSITGADVIKNLMQNHAPNQPEKIIVIEAFYFQIRGQLGMVSVMIMNNKVLLTNQVQNIDKILICIITHKVFF